MMFELNTQRSLWDHALVTLAEKDCEPEPELAAFLRQGPVVLGGNGLDIGCGLGRHTLTALRMGYEMAAIDFSKIAVQRTRQLVQSEGFDADARCASMHKLPFNDGEFNFAFSWCVLNHGTREIFEQAVSEAIRVLCSGGVMFGFVMSQHDSRFGNGRQVGEDCFAFTEGPENGICHYFPSEQNLVNLLERFSVIERLKEVFFDGNENAFYHPEMRRSCHFEFIARKH